MENYRKEDLLNMSNSQLIGLKYRTADSSLRYAIEAELKYRNREEERKFKTRADALLVKGFEAQGNSRIDSGK